MSITSICQRQQSLFCVIEGSTFTTMFLSAPIMFAGESLFVICPGALKLFCLGWCSECQGRSQCHNNLSKHQQPPSSQGQKMHMSLCLMIKCSLRDHLGWPVPCTSMSHTREGSSAGLSLVGCDGGWLLIGWDWPQMPHSAAAHPCLSCLGRLSQSQGITQPRCHRKLLKISICQVMSLST